MASSNPFEDLSEQYGRPSISSGIEHVSSSSQAENGTLEQTENSRIFHLYTASIVNYAVTLDDKTPLFYAKVSTFTPGKPDITLHAGNARHGAVAGASKFLKTSSDSKLCLGDPNDSLNGVWEDLSRESMDHSQYRFETTIDGQRRSFVWKRTHSVGVQDLRPGILSNYNYKLLDEKTGKLLGAYANKSLYVKKRGKFQLNKDYGRDFDVMFLLSGLTILERTRRRNAGRAS